MANSDKDIRVVPNRNKSGLPNIAFTGYNNDPIVLNVLDDNTISFEGSSGQLFSVSNAVTTGTIFSVNDISGIPSFRVDADGTVGIAEFSGNVGIGLQSPQSKLSVGGDINVGAGYTFRVAGTKVLDSSSLGTGVTGSSLTSVGTISSGTWQGTAIGINYGGTGATNASDSRSFLGAATAGTNSDLTRLLGVQHLFVTIPTAAAIGITVKAATSQAASMMEFVNSSNSVMSWITKDGTFSHGAYFTHSDGRVPGFSVQRANAAGIVARGYNSANFAAIEVQDNPGALVVGLYPSGLVYGGVLQAYSSTASTNTTTGALIVAGGAAIAGTTNFGRDVRIFSSLASSSPFTGSLVVSGGVGISNNLFVGGGVAFTSSIASTSTATGTLVVTGGVGIGGSVFTSTSNASSISGVVLSNGSVTLTGTYTQNNSSTTAFQVRDGSNNPAFVIDTIGDIISLPVAVASTSTSSGSLVVAGGVGIGGTLNVDRLKAISKITFEPGTGTSAVSGWTGIGLTSISKMIYGGGRFVGVGGSYAAYSTDGVNFTYTTISGSTSAAQYLDVAYGNGIYVAINQQDTPFIAYSYDGAAWGTTSIDRGLIRTVGFGNGRFLAFGEANQVVYSSTNGRNWSIVGYLGEYGREIHYANGYFLRSSGFYLYYSVDGASWKRSNTPGSNYIFASTYGKGIYVAAEYNSAQYHTSTDLVTWTTRTIDNRVWTGASYVNGVFYLIPNNNNNLYHSLDGINWSTTNFGTPIGGTQKMFTANDKLYLFSSIGPTLWSTDATTGTLMAKPFYNGEIENTRIGAVNPDSATFTHLTAFNNVTFTSATASTAADHGALTVLGGVGIGQTLNVAGSVNVSNSLNLVNTTTGIATSWTRTVVGTGATISYLAYANNLYVGVGYSSITSTDGVNWTTRTLPHNLSSVAFGNGIWSGLLGNSALGATSTNGTTWTSFAMTNSRNWTVIAFGNGKFVTLGLNSSVAAYSTNGFNWTEVTLPVSGIWVWLTYGGGYFVAVANASTTAVYSSDGINWTTTTLPSAAGWNCVTYGNGYFYVTGSSRFGVYSKDLINWTSYSTTIDGTAFVTYNNGSFVVADVNGATRTNIITGDFTSRTQIDLPGPQIPTALVAGDRVFIAGYGQTFYTFPIPNNSITLSPNTTGEINNVEIGNTKPASGAFSNIFSQGLVSFGATTPSISTSTGALVVKGGVGIGGSLFVGNTLSVASSTASTSTTTGALIVLGGMGISGNINSLGRFNFGTLAAPTMSTLSGFGTGGLTPSTTYYYKVSAIDFNNNESIPSAEYSVALSGSQYGTRFYLLPVNGAVGYKLYRTTTSGSYTNSFVQTYRSNQFINALFLYDVGRPTSTGTPLTTPTGNTATLGSDSTSPSNTLPSLTIPSGVLQVKSPNFTSYAATSRGVALETGAYDFVQIGQPYGYNNSVSVSTGGTLTAGQTYYYVFTCLDIYGNESLPSQEIAFTADSGGAAVFSFSIATVQQVTRRWYRTTTSGNYTNSYIGELYDHKDINFPTKNISPPTSTQFVGARILPAPDFGQYSYIPNIDVAPTSRNGAIRKIGTPYSGNLTLTTSGTAGSLLPNTTYYYKYVEVDIFGGSTYPSQEYSIGTGTSTSISINSNGNLWIEAKNYFKIYRSTTSNNYSNVPTYIVNSLPFTDVGDTTFTETPPSSATNITAQIFSNANNSVPQNYFQTLAIGPPSNNAPFAILAPQNGINSVTASTGGTLTSGQVYYYVMEPVDVGGFGGVAVQPIRFTATAGGAALITPYSILNQYGYTYYNLFRTTTLASWTNTLIASAVRGNFVDINYPTRSGSPNFGYHRARSILQYNNGIFFIPSLINQTYGQNLTPTGTPYRTGGNSAGTLTTNTTYYYRVIPFGGYAQAWGYASDEFSYTTGANERNISLTIGGHKTGAVGYRVYRSTTFNNFTNAYYFETQHTDFNDLGFSTAQTTPDLGSLASPTNSTVNRIDQLNGNVLVNTIITGQNGALKIHMKSPVNLSLSSGTGGTLANNTDYFYRVEAVDIYDAKSFPSEEAWINTSSNNAVTITWNEVPGTHYYRVYRTASSGNYTNTLIATYVKNRTFTDLNYPNITGTPYSFNNYGGTAAGAIFQIDNAKNFGTLPRTIITNVDSSQSSWNTDFSLRLVSPPVGSASAALLQVGAGFTFNSTAGFNGTTYGTQIAIGAAIGFTGSLLDAQTAGVSRFRINFDGSATIGSTTGSGSTSTGALVISGGVGIGQSLFTSPSYSSSISGAIFSNGSATLSGTYTQNNSSTTAFQVRDGSNNPAFVIDTISDIITLPVAVASTSTGTGSLVVAGGVGIGGSLFVGNNSSIGGTLNISGNASIGGTLNVSGNASIGGTLNIAGNASIGGTLNVSGSNSYFQNNLYVGNNTQGRLYFSQATLGSAGTTVIPTMAFIGATNSPITLSVLPDNSLSFDGSSGQLFSINNNLSTGWIFSINDISGLPIFRTNADLTVAMGEYGGNVGIGLSNPTFKLQVSGNAGISGTTLISNTTTSTNTTSGALVVSGGVGIGGSLNVTSASTISGVTINSGVITGSLTGTATTATYANQSGYAITSGSSNTSGYATTSGLATTATYSHQSGYAITSGSANTALYSDQSGYGLTSGLASTATYAHQSGYAITSGTATTATNVNVVSASTSASHPVLFTPASGTASGAALSTESTFVYNPSTDILSVSGLAVTATTTSTNSGTGALTVTGGVGISGRLHVGTSSTSIFDIPEYSVAGFAGSSDQAWVVIANTKTNFAENEDATVRLILKSSDSTGAISVGNTSYSGGNFSIEALYGLSFIAGADSSLNAPNMTFDVGTVTISGIGGATTSSTGYSTGALVVTGGAGIALTSYFGQDVKIQGTTGSASTTTGALIVSGGVGIGQTLNVGGYIGLWNGSNFTGLKSNASSNVIYTLPVSAPGTGSSVLQSDTSGILTWVPMTTSGTSTTSGFATTASYAYQSGYGLTSGLATTATYSYTSGYGITSGSANSWTTPRTLNLAGDLSGSVTWSGSGDTTITATIAANSVALGTDTTGQYASTLAISGSGITATSSNADDSTAYTIYSSATASNTASAIVLRDGSGNFSAGTITGSLTGTASTATYALQSGYGITAGSSATATTASNINVNNATAASAHFLHFSPSATGSGLATSSNTTLSYNPSTLILSTSGLAVTASTSSTTTSSGALIVTGGAGIGGSLFTSTSNASSISGVILNNGAITNTGTITSTGVMTLSNSSTTAFQVRDGSNNSTLTIDTIGDIVTLPVAVASTTTGTGSLVVAGGVGIGQSVSVGGRLQLFNSANYTAFVSSASGNTVYTLPATSPATGTSVLQSTSAGVMSWVPLAAGSGTVSTLTAGTGISFSTGATITTTGTIRARRPLVTSFCAGYTPAASGADSVVIRLPDSPSDGTTAITYEPQEFHIRVETASATTTTIQLEKYTGTGAFSGTAITSVSISGGSTYEAQTSVFAGAGIFLTSGDKLRINFTALSASHANFSVYLELEEV